jgi:hypothetical protein
LHRIGLAIGFGFEQFISKNTIQVLPQEFFISWFYGFAIAAGQTIS